VTKTFRMIMRETPPCRFCTQAKELLASRGMGVELEVIGRQHKEEFLRLGLVGDKATVPQIFAPDGSHIGGYTDLVLYFGGGN
jgi:glutaredoxin